MRGCSRCWCSERHSHAPRAGETGIEGASGGLCAGRLGLGREEDQDGEKCQRPQSRTQLMWPRIPGAPASVPSALCLHIKGVYVWGCLGGMCGCGTGRQDVGSGVWGSVWVWDRKAGCQGLWGHVWVGEWGWHVRGGVSGEGALGGGMQTPSQLWSQPRCLQGVS